MTAWISRRPPLAIRARERRSVLASVVVHAGVLTGLVLYEPPPVAEPLTEITFVDLPAATAPPPPADAPDPAAEATTPAAPIPAIVPEPTAREPKPTRNVSETPPEAPEHFVRERETAPVSPRPQSAEKLSDDVRSRLLAAGASSTDPRTARATTVVTPDRAERSGTATGAGPSASGRVALSRGTPVASGAPPSLRRGRAVAATSGARADLERIAAPERAGARAIAALSDSSATRRVAGASLIGPIADRPVLEHPSPIYPEWAKNAAVEGSVKLYFVVQPDGRARSSVLVEKTSGLPDFDENAVTALRAWRFEPLPAGATGDQWGLVTFDYRLTN